MSGHRRPRAIAKRVGRGALTLWRAIRRWLSTRHAAALYLTWSLFYYVGAPLLPLDHHRARGP